MYFWDGLSPDKRRNIRNTWRDSEAGLSTGGPVARGIRVCPLSEALGLDATTSFVRPMELLTGDALIVATMRQQGLTRLASEDADFDRVLGLTRVRVGLKPIGRSRFLQMTGRRRDPWSPGRTAPDRAMGRLPAAPRGVGTASHRCRGRSVRPSRDDTGPDRGERALIP